MSVSTFLRDKTYWARIPHPAKGAPAVRRSLGTEDARVQKDVAQFVRWANGNGDKYLWLCTEMAEGRIEVIDAYRAYQIDPAMKTFLSEKQGAISDKNLEPFVMKWFAEMERVNNPVEKERFTYLRQVRSLIPDGAPFRESQLTSEAIREWLTMVAAPVEDGGLGINAPNRYRAALSSFCAFLVKTKEGGKSIIPVNPVLAVEATREAEPRDRYLGLFGDSQDVALALCKNMEPQMGAFHALLICTAMDLNTGLARTARDIDLDARTVKAPGTKRWARKRTCTVYSRWFGLWKLVTDYMLTAPKTGLLFPDINEKNQAIARDASLKKLKIKNYLTKDHRHTWAVQALLDGVNLIAVAHQLGNNPAITATVYAHHIPKTADFANIKV